MSCIFMHAGHATKKKVLQDLQRFLLDPFSSCTPNFAQYCEHVFIVSIPGRPWGFQGLKVIDILYAIGPSFNKVDDKHILVFS